MNVASYKRPADEAELYRTLDAEALPVLFVAGATDVLVQARTGDGFAGRAAVDLTALPALREIREEGESLIVGATATFTQIAQSALVRAHAPLLAAAAEQIGAEQLRNRATIGGNVANASPAGDTLGPLAALGAAAVLDRLGERRELRFLDLIQGPGRTALADKEFIRAFRIPKMPSDTLWRFYKVGRRSAMSISRLTLSMVLELSGDEVVRKLSVGIGAAFQKPMRFAELEASAVGRTLDSAEIGRLAGAFSDTLPQIAGRRASTRYKQPVCRLAIARLLNEMRDEYAARTH